MKILDHPTRLTQPADYVTALALVRDALERHALLDPDEAEEPPPEPQLFPDLPPLDPSIPATLGTLCHRFGLSPFERDILVLCVGMELDAVFAPLCAKAQADPKRDGRRGAGRRAPPRPLPHRPVVGGVEGRVGDPRLGEVNGIGGTR